MSISDKEGYHLTISINKALIGTEAPIKTKHVRSAIIITHRTKEAKSFWMVISRQPLLENRFTAWKFCHLLHKVLREGHRSILKESQTHKKMIVEIGKLWGHLQDGVGYCILAYTTLLITKLSFHEKNRFFSGNLLIDFADIIRFADKDINVYFQLCVEIFDYLDEINNLQSQIFSTVNSYRMSSMTQQGQCRLAPLITLIQDSNALYDISVRLMFKLHDELPNDILCGHRDRFRNVFTNLKIFYENVRPLQYFADLIQVPHLPASTPNFSSKVDFGSYVPPVVLVQPEEESHVEDLIDTTTNSQQTVETGTDQEKTLDILETSIRNKDVIISKLQTDLMNLTRSSAENESIFQRQLLQLQEANATLHEELVSSKEMCTNIKLIKEELELQLEQTPSLMQKVTQEEEKAKLSVEKFCKLKTMYAQIRDEHIQLLRQQSESVKHLNKERQLRSDLESKMNSATTISNEYQEQSKKLSEVNAELKLQNADYEKRCQEMLITQTDLRKQITSLEIKVKKDSQNFQTERNELEKKLNDLQNVYSEISIFEEKLTKAENKVKERDEELFKTEADHNTQIQNKIFELNELEKKYKNDLKNFQIEVEQTKIDLQNCDLKLKEKEDFIDTLTKKQIVLDDKNKEFEKKGYQLEKELEKSVLEVNHLKNMNMECNLKRRNDIWSLYKSILTTMETICVEKKEESSLQPLEAILKISEQMENLVDKLYSTYINNCQHLSELCNDEFVNKALLLGYSYTRLYDQCATYSKSTSEIEKGDEILNQSRRMVEPLTLIFETMREKDENKNLSAHITLFKKELKNLKSMVQDIFNTFQINIDFDDLVQKELKEMEEAIAEAAAKIMNMLSSARDKDNGIKLEVNKSILDACTTLMESIKILIQKSRLLQNEIVSSQQGNATVKEFYKRNSQWSEGLISASKNIAKAANFLVDAANCAVTNENGNNFELIVAAQEIAACTAQLVIASKVKAPRESQNLVNLTRASRSVSNATGAVVASVKDGNQRMEQSIDVDLQKLTPSQMKTMEMEIQVKVLELEQALQTQRFKLTSFRRKHYQNTEY